MERREIDGWVVLEGQAKVSNEGWDSGACTTPQVPPPVPPEPEVLVHTCYPNMWVVEEGGEGG